MNIVINDYFYLKLMLKKVKFNIVLKDESRLDKCSLIDFEDNELYLSVNLGDNWYGKANVKIDEIKEITVG